MTTHKSTTHWELNEDAEDGSPAWLGVWLDEPEDMVLLTPATPEQYGWYESSNPGFVFSRETLDVVLTMSVEDAHEMLLARVSPRDRNWGEPFYV
jgi:hypothetical protein